MDIKRSHLRAGRGNRIKKLCSMLLTNDESTWEKTKALFAFEEGVTRRKVDEYMEILSKSGMLETYKNETATLK